MLNSNIDIKPMDKNNTDENKYYGFSFVKENAGGLGAALHAMMLAYFYAETNNFKFGLVEEGYKFPRLNGAINDNPTDGDDKNWHDYFKSLEIIKEKDTVAVWRMYAAQHNVKRIFDGKKIEVYSRLLKDIFVLQDDIQNKVNDLVEKSGFNPLTDVVLHIRRTDKIFYNKGSIIEAGELPIEVYIDETVKIVKNLNENSQTKYRVFLCTDDKTVCEEVAKIMAKDNIEVVWDKSETELHIQCMRLSGDLKRSDAWEENLTALKNLIIMAQSVHLVGGRMSYFFRIAELLRYPLPTKNLKDVEKFGKAPYAEDNEYFVNPIRDNRYLTFISDKYLNKTNEEWKFITDQLNNDYIIEIPDFLDAKLADTILNGINGFPDNWWSHAFRPNEQGERYYKKCTDTDLAVCSNAVQKSADSGRFAYQFKRTIGGHYPACKCTVCKLRDSMDSYGVMTILSKIVGKKVIGMDEMFASKYTRNDFLTLHHDKNKGNYTFILYLSKNWNPVHGGLTHFCDANKNIYRTEIPKFNNMVIFKLDPSRQMDHFVSQVCGPNPRYAYTGWFSVEQ